MVGHLPIRWPRFLLSNIETKVATYTCLPKKEAVHVAFRLRRHWVQFFSNPLNCQQSLPRLKRIPVCWSSYPAYCYDNRFRVFCKMLTKQSGIGLCYLMNYVGAYALTKQLKVFAVNLVSGRFEHVVGFSHNYRPFLGISVRGVTETVLYYLIPQNAIWPIAVTQAELAEPKV